MSTIIGRFYETFSRDALVNILKIVSINNNQIDHHGKSSGEGFV